jgi:hypothetical protein
MSEIKEYSLSLDDFFKLDFEDQFYCNAQNLVNYNEFAVNLKIIDNEECIYFFSEQKVLKHTRKVFYIKNEKNSCIYYNKLTKKIFIKKPKLLLSFFLKHYFKYYDILEHVLSSGTLPKTFFKNVIEKKITTLEDVMKFKKSYSLKDKTISSKALFNLQCIAPYKIATVGNFDLFEDIQNCHLLQSLNNYEIMNGKKIYKYEDLLTDPYNDYENWRKEKNNKIMQKLGL